jgi:betaine-aldehyde dehydrogenase
VLSKLWIGGKPAASRSGRTYRLVNPADGRSWAEVSEGGAADIDAAVAAASKAAPVWAAASPRERAAVLLRLARLVRENAKELALLETRTAGKPLADSGDEMGLAANVLEYYGGAATKHFGETTPVSAPGLHVTLREPVGVCGLIVPWNFPLVIATWKLGPALACGNSVVLKPSPETPLTALRLAELAAEAGLPDGVLNVVPGPGEGCGSALVEHGQVRKLSFTGSTSVGKGVMRAAADGLKRVSLELGGKSPNIVFDDADLELAAERSMWSVFGNTGQDCCARSRALVHKKVYDKFLSLFVAKTRKLKVGHPEKKGTQLGPIVSKRQLQRVSSYIEVARGEGARLVTGGGRPSGVPAGGFYLTPAVFEARPEQRIAREEVFGPVVCFIPFKDEAEAVRLANDSAYGLSGSIWTRDLGRGLRMAKAVQSGVLSVNSSSSVFLEAPFGGYKGSGLGRELGMKSLDAYTETKSVFLSST